MPVKRGNGKRSTLKMSPLIDRPRLPEERLLRKNAHGAPF